MLRNLRKNDFSGRWRVAGPAPSWQQKQTRRVSATDSVRRDETRERDPHVTDGQKGAPSVVSRQLLTKEIAQKIDRLPPFPAVVTQVMKVASDPTSSASDFEEFFRQDQVLAGRLLKLVNSAYFTLRHKISSITQAVTLLGYRSLKSLVIATSTINMFGSNMPSYGYNEGGLWMHSYACASLAKTLAVKLRLDPNQCEEVFVGGLLHDVGKLVLESYLRQTDFLSPSAQDNTILANEQTASGFNHCELGKRVAAKWDLAEDVAACVASHHNPVDVGENEQEVAIIHLADFYVGEMKIGIENPLPFSKQLHDAALSILKIPTDLLDESVVKFEDEKKSIEALYSEVR